MGKILLVLLSVLTLLTAKDYKNISLVDFLQILSHLTNKNYIISDTVNKDFHIFLPSYNFNNKKVSTNLLYNILKVNNLSHKNFDNVVLIYKSAPKPKLVKKIIKPIFKSHIIKYKYLTSNDIKSYISSMFTNVKFTILKGRILLTATDKDFELISKQLKILDLSYLHRYVSISVISTSNNKLKDNGTDFKAVFSDASKYINLITSTASFNTTLTNPVQFYSFINLLNQKGLTKLLINPKLYLSDGKNATIESTTNIPFLVSTTSTRDNTTTTRNSYKYKDIGLKVSFTNVIITSNQINFDLDIYIQSILDKTITPVTSSKYINTHIILDKNSTMLIGGLNSSDLYSSVSSIPVLEYVPIINNITSHKKEELKNETFTIIISD